MRALRISVCGLAAGLVLVLAPSARAARLTWTPCFSDAGPFQCGTLRVPLDYAKPRGADIGLALVKLPASDPAHRIGSLFVNPGGPGLSGVDFVVGAGQRLLTPEVRARFDIVGFDPRGVARSSPLRCFWNEKAWGPFFTPFAFPLTRDELGERIAADGYLDTRCSAHAGAIAAHTSSANVARDLDRMRAAVGDAGLSYYGLSYGTVIGTTYANLFPDRVRALILDGVVDPLRWYGVDRLDAVLPIFNRIQSYRGSQATLDEFFRLCDAGGARCAFGPNSAERFASLLARLREHPAQVTLPDGTTVVVDESIAIDFTRGQLYSSPGWESFAALLDDVDHQVPAARLGADVSRLPLPTAALGVQLDLRQLQRYDNQIESDVGVTCADAPRPTGYSAYWKAGRAADQISLFGADWTWIDSACARWPFPLDPDRYTGGFTAVTANPVLIVGTQFDPATPIAGAEELARLLPGSRLLVEHGWGHTSFLAPSSCAYEAEARYLIDETLPAPGTVCEQDHVPFTG
jgi:pimeloyl-ACP methyl ester carboxylesterase